MTMMEDTRRSSSSRHTKQQTNSSVRRRILPPIYGGTSILQEVHLVSPHRETRPRSGSDSSSSSPTSAMDVPQSSSTSLLLMTSFTQSPGLRRKGGKQVDPLTTLSSCTAPVLSITKEEPTSASRTSSLETCLELQRNERSTTLREFRNNNNSRSFRKSHSVPIDSRPLTPPQESSCRRRSIFDTFWKSEKSFNCHPPPPPPMGDADDASSSAATGEDTLPLHLTTPWLPAVPTPLVRMHSHCGVYPLVTPRSILRKTKSLGSRSDRNSHSAEHSHWRSDGLLSPASTQGPAFFNLTQSMRIPPSCTSEGDEQPTDPQSQQQHPRSVHFDPRVVVTELADAEPRVWYTDEELQTFQAETVLVARAYLHSHPQLIPLYSQPVRNTVTGGMRKRALFSLGAFRQEEQQVEEEVSVVRRIRIVDPHPAMLALLRRSFAALFPEAYIECSCGDDGEEQQQQQASSWDILVLDGSLLNSRSTTTTAATKSSHCSTTLVIGLRHRRSNKTAAVAAWKEADVVDIVWDKPIPSLNSALRQSLLQALGEKQRRYSAASV